MAGVSVQAAGSIINSIGTSPKFESWNLNIPSFRGTIKGTGWLRARSFYDRAPAVTNMTRLLLAHASDRRFGFWAAVWPLREARDLNNLLPQCPRRRNRRPRRAQDQQQSGQPGFAISTTVPLVNVDVVVTDNDGNYLNDLKKENFRIIEDGAPQTITNFGTTDAPITVVLLLEFSQLGYGWFLYNAVIGPMYFCTSSSPTIGSRSNPSTCAPTSKSTSRTIPVKLSRASSRCIFPPFHESNIFDALVDVTDRLQDVKGKKAVLVFASGIDTFSRLTLDKTLAKLKKPTSPSIA